MRYAEIKTELQDLGLKEIAAGMWATKLTQDGREPSREEVHAFAEKTLPAVRRRAQEQRDRRPAELLTTPEERLRNN